MVAFDTRWASINKKEGISNRLIHLSIFECRKVQGDDHAALDNLIENVKRISPMDNPKDRDEEDKLRYLKEAVKGTDWGIRAATRVTDKQSYQSMISAKLVTTILRPVPLCERKRKIKNRKFDVQAEAVG